MAIPDFQSLMRPLLELASDGKEHSLHEAREHLAVKLGLTESEQKALLPSGRQRVFANRLAWAKIYLQRAGIFDSLQRGCFKISDRGRTVLKEAPERITIKYLDRFPEFVEFRSTPRKQKETAPAITSDEEGQTPEETLEAAHHKLHTDLASELLGRVKKCSPQFFERLVVELLLKMGYGGSRKEAGEDRFWRRSERGDFIRSQTDRLGLFCGRMSFPDSVGGPDRRALERRR